MAVLNRAYNADGNKEKMSDFSPIPSGDYIAILTKSEWKETKAKNGHILNLQWKIIEGEYKGRILFAGLNLDNPNAQTVEIANKEMNTICDACGKFGVQDTEELHNIPCLLKVGMSKATPQYPAKNEIKFYDKAPAGGQVTNEGTAAAGQTSEQQPAAEKKKLPWE